MSTFVSPTGNFEIWQEKPKGYYTVQEWRELNPSPPTPPLTIQEKIERIQLKYRPSLNGLISACSTAQMLGDIEDADSTKAEYADLLRQQGEEIAAIQNGGA